MSGESFHGSKFRVSPQWVANRVEALHAFLNGDPEGVEWLESTGMARELRQVQTGAYVDCCCPFCEGRAVVRRGDVGGLVSSSGPLRPPVRAPARPERFSGNGPYIRNQPTTGENL